MTCGLHAQELKVTGIQARYRNGQTFVTWKDAAEGEADAKLYYALYGSDKPITQNNLAEAELLQKNIFYNSARLLGYAFSEKSRLDPAKPMVILEEGAKPLPMWSGVTAVTARKNARNYYAVVAMNSAGAPLSQVVPGESALTGSVEERVAPIQPIRFNSAKNSAGQPIVLQKKQPLRVEFHASNSYASDRFYDADGDNYLYFATSDMGYRDGLQGVFQVKENRSRLVLASFDAIEKPYGDPLNFTRETFWFGYLCVPQWANDKKPRAYPFTEKRMLWIMDWVMKTYDVDTNRVYAGGGSMGAWGSTTFALRHPEIFAAVYPSRPRTRQIGLPVMDRDRKSVLMDDGKTDYYKRMDMVNFVTERHDDLPFYAWCCGRHDGFATFKEQIDMVKAMTANHHGFAFAWNDGDHAGGVQALYNVTNYYGEQLFALNQSYPAFGNSSINDDIGSGEMEEVVDGKWHRVVQDGQREGGINLGFAWKILADEELKWAVTLSNDLAKVEMTVDVTPRRCQKFKTKAGDKFKWANTAGGNGEVTADAWGLVTVEKVKIRPGAETTLTISQ